MKAGKILGFVAGGIGSYIATAATFPTLAGLATTAGWTGVAGGLTSAATWTAGAPVFGGLVTSAAAGVGSLITTLAGWGLGATVAAPLVAAVLVIGAGLLVSNLCKKIGNAIDNKIEAAKIERGQGPQQQMEQQRGPQQQQNVQLGAHNPLLAQNQSKPLEPLHSKGQVDYSQDPSHPAYQSTRNHADAYQQTRQMTSRSPLVPG